MLSHQRLLSTRAYLSAASHQLREKEREHEEINLACGASEVWLVEFVMVLSRPDDFARECTCIS
jgi:hypothetical protein